MRTYVGITGLAFAVIFAAHVARVWSEGTGPLTQPTFLITSALSLGLSVWAVVLLSNRRSG